ncbi:putative N-acetyltransferase camello [Mixophyes fleayi]|uniref:putative N-acetyltransferase camello n=1 Tax=Mixophyes fleayi TaxID=3061075 RepID=UPI003F4DB899
MADFSIRTYKDRDYNAVRALFAEGLLSYIPSTSVHLLKRPHVYMTIFVSLVTLHLVFKSYLLSVSSVGILLAAGFIVMKTIFNSYINKCYREDLLNIKESYMTAHNSCFWVAESNGRVVGMVGVQPVQDSCHDVVLRRLSVATDQRHRGVAQKLCMAVIDFARQRGYKHVTLDTSTLLHACHRLYLRLGFRITRVKRHQTLTGRIADVSVIYYAYDIKT